MPRNPDMPANPDVAAAALAELAFLDVEPAPDLSAASCKGTDPEAWMPNSNDAMALAILRRVCAGCACRDACAEWAMSQPYWLTGVFAGMTQADRDRVRASRRETKEAAA
jgi:WhiB family transcriptional regulator, redox-sensing transcriptional regulator